MTGGSWPALTEIIRSERWKWDTEASAAGILQHLQPSEGTMLAAASSVGTAREGSGGRRGTARNHSEHLAWIATGVL